MVIGSKIKQIRKRKGLTQTQVEQRGNITSSMIGKWELGDRMPNAKNIIQLCQALGCTPNELFDWENR